MEPFSVFKIKNTIVQKADKGDPFVILNGKYYVCEIKKDSKDSPRLQKVYMLFQALKSFYPGD